MSTTLTQLETVLSARFHGLLRYGKHAENGAACALELLSAVRGIPWTDDPESVGCWDLRSLNDVDVSDEVRTKYLLPVLAAYSGCRDWPIERQVAVASALAIGTVRTLIPDLPGLPAAIAARCSEADTCAAAAAASAAAASASAAAFAASAAASDAAFAAASDAASAADASAAAAYAAATAAVAARHAAAANIKEEVFIRACQVWLDAAV